MARFCTSCGSPVEEILKFCPNCGTQLGVPAAPAPASAAPTPAPGPGAPMAAVPPAAAPAAKAGSPFLKILLIVLGIFAFVTVLGIGSCIYIGYRVKKKADQLKQTFKVDQSGKSVTVTTPQGAITFGERKGAAALTEIGGVPPYPGSTPVEGGGEVSLGGKVGISGQEFETADPVNKVVAFYKEKLGPKAQVLESEGSAQFTLATDKGLSTVTIARNEEAGKTKISIGFMGK